MITRNRMWVPIVLAVAVSLAAAAPARAEEPTVWLHVEVVGTGHDVPNVKVTLPISLVEVVLESVDTHHGFLTHVGKDGEINLAKIWKQVRNLELDEFVTIDSEEGKVKVFKDSRYFRVTVQEPEYEQPNMQVKIPLALMDYLFDEQREGFKFSEMLASLRGSLPLTIIEATHEEGQVKVWLDEK